MPADAQLFDPYQSSVAKWPLFFDLENIPQVRKADLKPMPQVRKNDTTMDILQKFDIRRNEDSLVEYLKEYEQNIN